MWPLCDGGRRDGGQEECYEWESHSLVLGRGGTREKVVMGYQHVEEWE